MFKPSLLDRLFTLVFWGIIIFLIGYYLYCSSKREELIHNIRREQLQLLKRLNKEK